MTEWESALDALEQWVRQTAADLSSPDPGSPLPPPRLPAGVVPEALRLRSQALLSTMRETESDVLRRREQLRREQAYGAV